jgi:hypothetical protein
MANEQQPRYWNHNGFADRNRQWLMKWMVECKTYREQGIKEAK